MTILFQMVCDYWMSGGAHGLTTQGDVLQREELRFVSYTILKKGPRSNASRNEKVKTVELEKLFCKLYIVLFFFKLKSP